VLVLDEGDDAHLCFTFGTLQGVYFIYSFYARGPTTSSEVSTIIAFCFTFRWSGELSALPSTPTGVSAVVPGYGLVGLRYVTGEGGEELQSIKLMSGIVFGGIGNDIVLD